MLNHAGGISVDPATGSSTYIYLDPTFKSTIVKVSQYQVNEFYMYVQVRQYQ